MKAVTVRQPWASLIVHGVTWDGVTSFQHSGPLAIHAAARKPRADEAVQYGRVIRDATGDLMFMLRRPFTEEDQIAAGLEPDGDLIGFPLPLGAIVGTVNVRRGIWQFFDPQLIWPPVTISGTRGLWSWVEYPAAREC